MAPHSSHSVRVAISWVATYCRHEVGRFYRLRSVAAAAAR
jgi:phosphatidylserine decarboxylase